MTRIPEWRELIDAPPEARISRLSQARIYTHIIRYTPRHMKTVLKAFSVISHISCKLKGGDLSWRGRIEEIVLVGSSCFRAAGMSPLGGHVSVPAQYEAQMRRLGISGEPHENWHIFEVRRRRLCWYLFLRPLFRQHTRGYQYSFNSFLAPEKESGNVVSPCTLGRTQATYCAAPTTGRLCQARYASPTHS